MWDLCGGHFGDVGDAEAHVPDLKREPEDDGGAHHEAEELPARSTARSKEKLSGGNEVHWQDTGQIGAGATSFDAVKLTNSVAQTIRRLMQPTW